LASEFPGWNPYHYVHNNPLKYTDPTGMSANDIIIQAKKGEEHIATKTFAHLQSLTTQKLEMESKGYVTFATSGEGNKGATEEGTNLVAALINDKSKIVTITNDLSNTDIKPSSLESTSIASPHSSENAINGIGTNTTIYFSPSVVGEFKNTEGGTSKAHANRVLAHELIHADHNRTGSNARKYEPTGEQFPSTREEQNTVMRENKMFKTQRFDGQNGKQK
ncbi:MAG TPA: M91 family zinc metallopeptidase, partial [Saprospiraceae bacterium]|nr:M91 family zinc metallopeptidase [Saprospiraceae bacterium]